MLPRDLESCVQLVATTFLTLPPTEQLLLRLRYCDELGCDAIASIFGTSRSAIHVRLHRARDHLRTLVAERLQPETAITR